MEKLTRKQLEAQNCLLFQKVLNLEKENEILQDRLCFHSKKAAEYLQKLSDLQQKQYNLEKIEQLENENKQLAKDFNAINQLYTNLIINGNRK